MHHQSYNWYDVNTADMKPPIPHQESLALKPKTFGKNYEP